MVNVKKNIYLALFKASISAIPWTIRMKQNLSEGSMSFFVSTNEQNS